MCFLLIQLEIMDSSDEEAGVTDISDDEFDGEGHNGDMDGAKGGGSDGENGEVKTVLKAPVVRITNLATLKHFLFY